MKLFLIAIATAITLSGSVLADSDDDRGKYRWRGDYRYVYPDHGYARFDREFKEEIRIGNCKIKREWKRNGDYEEERKCKGGRD